jgi:hypothetical protein
VRRPVACALVVATLCAPARARGQETATETASAGGSELARCDAGVRTIQRTLDDDARRTRVWYWAWMATGTALLGGQTVLSAVTSGDTQKEFIAGALTSTFIPGMLLLHPPVVLSESRRLDARIDATSVAGRLGDPCIVLPRAQELLSRSADDQALATGWFAHVFVIGGNIAVGLILGLGFGDWAGAVKQAVGGSAVGELQILTLPTGALKARGLGLAGSF